MFRRKKASSFGSEKYAGEERFEVMLAQVKHLDKKEFNKTISALELAWQGYNKMLEVQTIEEKELADIDKVEKTMEAIEAKSKRGKK